MVPDERWKPEWAKVVQGGIFKGWIRPLAQTQKTPFFPLSMSGLESSSLAYPGLLFLTTSIVKFSRSSKVLSGTKHNAALQLCWLLYINLNYSILVSEGWNPAPIFSHILATCFSHTLALILVLSHRKLVQLTKHECYSVRQKVKGGFCLFVRVFFWVWFLWI